MLITVHIFTKSREANLSAGHIGISSLQPNAADCVPVLSDADIQATGVVGARVTADNSHVPVLTSC